MLIRKIYLIWNESMKEHRDVTLYKAWTPSLKWKMINKKKKNFNQFTKQTIQGSWVFFLWQLNSVLKYYTFHWKSQPLANKLSKGCVMMTQIVQLVDNMARMRRRQKTLIEAKWLAVWNCCRGFAFSSFTYKYQQDVEECKKSMNFSWSRIGTKLNRVMVVG